MASVLGVGAMTGVGSGDGGAVVEGSRRCPRLGRSVPFSGVRLATAILGTRASYKSMAAGPTTQKFRVAPYQGAREKGRSGLGPSIDPDSWDQPNILSLDLKT
jgi:hypothetical protein